MKRRLAHDRKDGILSPIRKRPALSREFEDEVQDNGYYAAEVETLDYEPTAFIRCHSRIRADAADVSTQVWQCAFEPNVSDPGRDTNIAATCGGNSVCLIDVRSGQVLRQYYAKDIREKFYSLAWTTVIGGDSDTNVLVAGGALHTLHFVHPDTNTVFLQHKLHGLKFSQFVSTLLFDTHQSHILYCGLNDGQVLIFNVGQPRPPHFVKSISLLHTLHAASELFTLARCAHTNALLAGTNDGLVGWQMPQVAAREMKSPPLVRFRFPASAAAAASGTQLVDSVLSLRDGQAATKCALHGVVYVWDVGQALRHPTHHITPLHTLRWSDTDNYFMNMGYSAGSGLLCCGDDKGMLWLYNMRALDEAKSPDSAKSTDRPKSPDRAKSPDLVQPTAVLQWPEVDDQYIALKRKLRLDVYDIVVDKVAIDSSGEHIVAVTANNMVCVWKRLREPRF